MKHTIDASNKTLGRVASEAARLLMAKDSVEFVRNQVPEVQVVIENAKQMKIDEKKKEQKRFPWFSGYPGGLRFETLDHALNSRGVGEVLRRSVYGMLPKNKLRSKMIKNLTVTE